MCLIQSVNLYPAFLLCIKLILNIQIRHIEKTANHMLKEIHGLHILL